MIALLRSLRFFVWIVVSVAAFLFYQFIGLPHVIWSYSFRDNGSPYDLSVPRYYTRCTFVGPYGVINALPKNGKCEWVRFFREEDAG